MMVKIFCSALLFSLLIDCWASSGCKSKANHIIKALCASQSINQSVSVYFTLKQPLNKFECNYNFKIIKSHSKLYSRCNVVYFWKTFFLKLSHWNIMKDDMILWIIHCIEALKKISNFSFLVFPTSLQEQNLSDAEVFHSLQICFRHFTGKLLLLSFFLWF